jgi:hypothetical protein
MPFDATKPHSVHSDQKRITTYDQGGVLYDSITLAPLPENPPQSVKDSYVIPDDAPFSRVKSEHERWDDAINTMLASNSLSGEDASKLRRMVAESKEVEQEQ